MSVYAGTRNKPLFLNVLQHDFPYEQQGNKEKTSPTERRRDAPQTNRCSLRMVSAYLARGELLGWVLGCIRDGLEIPAHQDAFPVS
jgi:hypothetical protein